MSQLFQTGIIISRGNSTSIPLAAHETFIGSTDDVTSYEGIDINIFGEPNDAPGAIYFEFSPDGIHWDVSVWIGNDDLPGPNIVPQNLRVILPYFRVKYINGPIPQTVFRLTISYHRVSGPRLTRYLDQTITDVEPIEVTRSVIVGQVSDGYYGNLACNINNVLMVDGSATTQPISGTVMADQGLPTILAAAWPMQITDGVSTVGITDVLGNKALKVDVIKTVASGSVGSGGTSSNFGDPFPVAGTSAGFSDGYYMQGATVFDLDTGAGTQYGLGVNLRQSADGGSIEVGTLANPLHVDASSTAPQPPANFTASGTIGAPGNSVTVDTIGCSHVAVSITGTWSGDISFQGTIDGSIYFDISAFPIVTSTGSMTASAALGQEDTTTNGFFLLNAIGYANVKVVAITWSSGSASIFMRGTVGDGPPEVQPIIPADGASVDAFSRQRVSSPESLFSSKQIFDKQPLFWDDQQISGASTSSTYQTNQASTKMTVANNVAGVRVRQTFRRWNYQSGKSTQITMTGILVAEGGTGNAFTNRRLGLFDGYNGVFFVMTGTTPGVAVRTFASGSAVTNVINQSNWNLDTFDGSGSQNNPSGIFLDVSKTQIFVIDFQWLGSGRIRFGFSMAGRTIYCHQVLNANVNSAVYMSTPNLPLRYEIESLGTGTSATSSLLHICSAVEVEAGFEDIGYQLAIDTGASILITGNNTSIYSLLAIQLQSGFGGANIIPTYINVTCTDNTSYRYGLVLNPTIVGTTLSYTTVSNSAVQFAITDNTNTLTGGTVIFSDYAISAKNNASSVVVPGQLQLGTNIAGVSDTLVLFVQPVPAFSGHYVGAINWREIV